MVSYLCKKFSLISFLVGYAKLCIIKCPKITTKVVMCLFFILTFNTEKQLTYDSKWYKELESLACLLS